MSALDARWGGESDRLLDVGCPVERSGRTTRRALVNGAYLLRIPFRPIPDLSALSSRVGRRVVDEWGGIRARVELRSDGRTWWGLIGRVDVLVRIGGTRLGRVG